MSIKKTYINLEEETFMLGLINTYSKDLRVIDNLKNKQKEGNYRYLNKTIEVNKIKLPLIALLTTNINEDYFNSRYGMAIEKKIKEEHKKYKYFTKLNFKNEIQNSIYLSKQDNDIYTLLDRFLIIIEDDILILFPNPYCLFFNIEEINIVNEETFFSVGDYYLKSELKTEAFLKELSKRRKEFFNQNIEVTNKLLELINRNYWCILNILPAFNTNFTLFFSKNSYIINLLKNYDFIPFKYDFRNKKIIMHNSEEIKTSIETYNNWKKKEQILIEQITPLLNEFKKLGYDKIEVENIVYNKEKDEYKYYIKGFVKDGYLKIKEISDYFNFNELELLLKKERLSK